MCILQMSLVSLLHAVNRAGIYVTAGLVTSFSDAGGKRMYILDCESVVDLLAVS